MFQTVIEYCGLLNFKIISNLLNELKSKTEAMAETVVTYKRVLIISVEVLENILKYFESQNTAEEFFLKHPVFFQILKGNETYRVKARNVISTELEAGIREKIDLVNGLDVEQLKKLYRKTISNGQFTEEGGAGLGFIEIAKTSSGKIAYSFEKVNDTLTYFTIDITI